MRESKPSENFIGFVESDKLIVKFIEKAKDQKQPRRKKNSQYTPEEKLCKSVWREFVHQTSGTI